MSDRERSGPDDVEGHRRSYQDTEATDEAQMTTEDMERRKNY